MAIQIPNIQKIAKRYATSPYLFKDLHIDFDKTQITNEFSQGSISGNDVEVDYDLKAIYNSLRNLFNTKKGQRFLFPTYGLDLNQFLFEPISNTNAQTIGEVIVRSIEKYEPRVLVKTCFVEPVFDDNVYNITIEIEVLISKSNQKFSGTIDTKTKSIIFLETARNT